MFMGVMVDVDDIGDDVASSGSILYEYTISNTGDK
jgi:hypothetical protein